MIKWWQIIEKILNNYQLQYRIPRVTRLDCTKLFHVVIILYHNLYHVFVCFRATQVVVDRPATAENIKVTGPGLNPKYVRANTPMTFKVDATKAAKGNLDVKMTTDKGKEKKTICFSDERVEARMTLFR